MYASYWQLHDKPFENGCDPRFYFPAESHQSALLKLRYVVENRRGGAVLAGPAGCGKTLLVAMLRASLGPEFGPIVHLVFPQMAPDQLLAYLAADLTGAGELSDNWALHHSVRRIEHFLVENATKGRHAVVILDEAHLIDDPAALEAMRLLLNFQWQGNAGLTLLLAGQPAVLPILDRMPHLEERLSVKCLLRPLSRTETAQYVAHRFQVSGATRPVVDEDALDAIHRLTHGIPRRINRLCDLALLVGFAEGLSSIAAEQLTAVHQELITAVPQ